MKKKIIGMILGVTLIIWSGAAKAALITIGTATYDDGNGAAEYNLIWDDDNNGNSVVWLDYTNNFTNFDAQNVWAAGLSSALAIHLLDGYNLTWTDSEWRLPEVDFSSATPVSGGTYTNQWSWGYDGTTHAGYNITYSEFGHLYYDELGNHGGYDEYGVYQASYQNLQNTGIFENLQNSRYWSSNEFGLWWYYQDGRMQATYKYAWAFDMRGGWQDKEERTWAGLGMALRNATITNTPVPEPATALLFGIGLLGIAGVSRKKK